MGLTRMAPRIRISLKVGVVALVLMVVAACGSSAKNAATGSSPTKAATGSSAGSGKTIKLALIDDVTGPRSVTVGTGLPAMEAAVAEANAAGGVNGHKITYKVYDAQSTPAGGLQAARAAIGDKVFAVVAMSVGLNSGLPTLSNAGIPTIGDGDSPNWSNRPAIFSISGNLITQNTTAWADVLISQGRTRIAVPGGTINPQATYVWKDLVGFAGGTTCFFRIGIDATNTATIVAVAHQIIEAKCQGVMPPTLGANIAALQQALNQLGGNVAVVDPADIGPEIPQQYGSSIDKLMYANFFASPYTTGNKGVDEYRAAMKKYQPGKPTECFCIKGYAVMKWALHALGQVQGELTQAKFIQALDATHGYDADGLVPPIEFPQFHTVGAVCLSYSVIKNGRWEALKNGPSPFICGKRFIPSTTPPAK
jgi:branched-chain amino acid transport system substrate-binding protein